MRFNYNRNFNKRFNSNRNRRFGGFKKSFSSNGNNNSNIMSDVSKFSFPRKIKVLGLVDTKVKFLLNTTKLNLMGPEERNPNAPQIAPDMTAHIKQWYLSPSKSENFDSLFTTVVGAGPNGTDVRICSYETIQVEAIYIAIQPTSNSFIAGGGEIATVQCFYSLENDLFEANDGNLYDVENNVNARRVDALKRKQKHLFSFQSNEAFTFALTAPQSMVSGSGVIHPSRQQWSLAEMYDFARGELNRQCVEEEDLPPRNGKSKHPVEMDEDENVELEYDDLQQFIHYGKLIFRSNGPCNFNATVAYKTVVKN